MKEGKPTMRQRLYEAMKSDTPELDIWDLLEERYNDGHEKSTNTIICFALFAMAVGFAIGYAAHVHP